MKEPDDSDGIFPGVLREIVRAALAEDLGPRGDVTTRAIVSAAVRARGRIVARQDLVLAGGAAASEVFRQIDPAVRWQGVADGTVLSSGATAATLAGPAGALLTGERTALNFLQRLSGIATQARRAVEEVAGTKTVILDTRKTTPSLRALEKRAVAAGGASNHRAGLFDAVLIKDNHVALAGGVGEAIRRAVAAGHPAGSIEVEVDDLDQLDAALAAGAGRILLDNFTPEQAGRAIRRIAGRALVECSGGLRPGGLRAYADAGADFLSLGWLTHSATAADLSLEIEPWSEP